MMTEVRSNLLKALDELGRRHPHWRFGQLVVNVALWARETRPVELWDVEDEELLQAVVTHLEQQAAQQVSG